MRHGRLTFRVPGRAQGHLRDQLFKAAQLAHVDLAAKAVAGEGVRAQLGIDVVFKQLAGLFRKTGAEKQACLLYTSRCV